jgi:mono/diheme cytochrome c family protein
MSFDPATGALWLGDVGSSHLEEVNRILAGGNYQFPFAEGDRPMARRPARVIGQEMPPVYAYPHTAYERSIIGGLVYRGERYPALAGKYLFADNYSGHVYALDITSDDSGPPRVLARSPDVAQRGITSLTTSPDGAILLTTLGDDDHPSGRILELVPAGEAGSSAGARPLEARADQPVDCARAEADYRQYCARCHGLSGTGDGSESASFEGLILPDFTDPGWQSGWTDQDLRRVIQDGGEASGLSAYMPPWQGILAAPAIEAVAGYLRRFAQGGRCPESVARGVI